MTPAELSLRLSAIRDRILADDPKEPHSTVVSDRRWLVAQLDAAMGELWQPDDAAPKPTEQELREKLGEAFGIAPDQVEPHTFSLARYIVDQRELAALIRPNASASIRARMREMAAELDRMSEDEHAAKAQKNAKVKP